MISSQLSPERPPEVFAGCYGFVARDYARCGWFPELSILARRDDRSSPSSSDYVVASARIIGSTGGDGSNLLIQWDLLQKVRQHWSVADIASRDPNRADLKCFFVHTEVKLAP